MKKLLILLTLVCIPFIAGSHIGSPGVTFEGNAGPYSVLVLVTPPDVIPGTATIDIYTKSSGITAVWGKPVYWFAGAKGAPSSDEMLPVAGEPGHFRGMIWLMNPGTSGIHLQLKGESGEGTILVPVMAVSTAQKEMPSSLGWILLALCVLLVGLMTTIISASVSDGLVKPNEAITKQVLRKRWIGAAVSAALLITIVWGGKTWWESWASNYSRFMYKPYKSTATVLPDRTLEFKIDTTRFRNLSYTRKLSYVVPDHGKLMHMFLVRAGSLDVFAHLHPQRKDSATYITPLPPLPPGKYLVFADITRLSGFAETIPGSFEISDNVPATFASLDSSTFHRDDTYFSTNPISKIENQTVSDNIIICGKPGVKTPLQDGSTAIWEQPAGERLVAGKLYELKFNILDENNKPAQLQPYLGMMGHAVVMKDDGSVYIHLHPVGSYSMASQQTMLNRFQSEAGPVDWTRLTKPAIFMDSIDHVVKQLDAMTEDERNKVLMTGMTHESTSDHPEHSVVTFPYAFPSAGNYRIWIQMKRNGKILNSAFDTVVEP